MKINKGLGYIATAIVVVATLYFTKNAFAAIVMAIIGFGAVSDDKD